MTRNKWFRPVQTNEARRTRCKPLVLESLEDRTVPSFLPPVSYPVGGSPWSTATGDFNADGNRDFATGNTEPSSISVWMGVGDGTFSGLTTLATLGSPYWIAVADLNSDGCDDVLYSHGGARPLSVHHSNCDGTFAPRLNYAAGPQPNGITVADYDLDGYLDVATANYGGTASVMLGGAGGFGAPVTYATGAWAELIISDDVNYDGAQDLIVSGDEHLSILINNSDGTFATAVNYPAGEFTLGIVSADLDGDGLVDLATTKPNGGLSILIGNGDGTYQAATHIDLGPKNFPTLIAAADFDWNGTLDLAIGNVEEDGQRVRVLLGNGDGTFQIPMDIFTPGTPFGVVTDDFNLDGYADLLTANGGPDGVSVLINDGVWGPAPQGGGNGGVVWQLTSPEHAGFVPTPTPAAPRATAAAVVATLPEWMASPVPAPVVAAVRRTETIKAVDELFGLKLL